MILGPNQIVIGSFGDNIIEVLKSSTDVEYIAEDGIMTTFDIQYVGPWPSTRSCYSNIHARNDAPWNLARISTRARLTNQDPYALNYTYQYLSNPGDGVDIYVVDTGLFSPFVRVLKVSQHISRKVSSSTTCARFVR